MKKVTVKFIYDGKSDDEVDVKIAKVAEEAGMSWYAQGYDFTRDKRDVCFDLNE